ALTRRQGHRRRVEGMVVNDFVAAFAHHLIDPLEGPSGSGRPGAGARWSVKRGRQLSVIDARVDHLDPPHGRSRGGIKLYLVAPADEPARELGHERLRATPLRLPDRADQRGDDRQLHPAVTLKATSRGGLTPRVSNDTRRRPLRRTPAATSG